MPASEKSIRPDSKSPGPQGPGGGDNEERLDATSTEEATMSYRMKRKGKRRGR
jgi:hypothetical protein